jgi:mannitol 2-dehydrogenase
MTILTGATLAQLNAGVARPRYDRRQVTAGIVHIGVGGFHRSHQAMYIDTLMNRGAAMDWVFGDLADDTRFTRVYRSILTALLGEGVRKTLADLDQYA